MANRPFKQSKPAVVDRARPEFKCPYNLAQTILQSSRPRIIVQYLRDGCLTVLHYAVDRPRMFNFTPLLGAQSTSPASQSLLEFEGGIKVLVDVGWDSDFEVSQLRELEKYVESTYEILLAYHSVEID